MPKNGIFQSFLIFAAIAGIHIGYKHIHYIITHYT